MLIGHHVVLVLWIYGLQVRRHVNLVVWEAVLAEVVEEVGVAGAVEVDLGVAGVFVL